MAATGAVAGGIVVMGGGVMAARVRGQCRRKVPHSRLGRREAGLVVVVVVVVDSRVSVVRAGRPRVLSRCRVPYWRDALPWGRWESRVTAVAA
jgi:hypothetical protein